MIKSAFVPLARSRIRWLIERNDQLTFMKKHILMTIIGASLFAAGAVEVYAEKVKLSELPAAVQTAVKAQTGSAEIEDIDKEIRNGRVVYEVAFKRNGQHTELLVGADGTVLEGGGVSTPAPPGAIVSSVSKVKIPLAGARKVPLDEVPLAVQNVIRTQAGQARIEDIDKGVLNGKTVYEAAFKKEGENIELRVAEDGNILTETKSEGLMATLNAFPAAVQKTIRTQAGPGQIVDVDKNVQKNATIYAAEFQRDGKNQVIHVAEDGALLRHRIKKAARGEQIISSWEPRKVTMNEVPAIVQNTIRSQAGRDRIEDIDRMVKDGRTVYQAAFKRYGKHTELLVAEDGSIVQGTPTVAKRGSLFGPTVTELPRAVQNTIKAAQLGGGEVANIERQVRNGRTVFAVELDQRGKTREIVIAEDGSIVGE
jgi:uncharacterized membrane protein YkoI